MDFYECELPKWQQRISKANINEEMKNLILKFDKLWGISIRPATRIFYLKTLKILACYFKDKAPSQISKDDLIVFFDEIKNNRGERLIQQLKIATKKFFKEIYGTEDYPPLVRWIKSKRISKPAVTKEMLLTSEEVKRMVEVCDNSRDRAFIMLLAESTFRRSEMFNIKLKDIRFGENVTSITVDGKTGQRLVPIIHAVPYLKNWINEHPFRDNNESFLWVCTGRKNFGKQLKPDPMLRRLKTAARRAGINKRVYFHLFRHTQLTELVKNGYSEIYLKKHAGWSGSSKMAEVYVHLAFDDVERKYLEINGMVPEKQKTENALRAKTCTRCSEMNPATNKICNKCLFVLDLQTALEIEEKRKLADNLMNLLIQKPRVREAIEAELAEIEKEKEFQG